MRSRLVRENIILLFAINVGIHPERRYEVAKNENFSTFCHSACREYRREWHPEGGNILIMGKASSIARSHCECCFVRV